MEEWERGREWKKGEGMGMWEEWAKAGIDKGADNKIKQTPHSRESGNLPVSEAGRATLAPHRFVICADGAGIGRFPLSREWGILFLLSAPFSIPARPFTFSPLFPFHYSHSPHSPHSRESGNLPVVEAGRATRATLRFVICADGAGIGKFPTAREGGIL